MLRSMGVGLGKEEGMRLTEEEVRRRAGGTIDFGDGNEEEAFPWAFGL